jgi:NAD(P)-dependent dehydrogenase (short-subunit alcohol dehydrogenase family)
MSHDAMAIVDRAFSGSALGQQSPTRWHYASGLSDEAAFEATLAEVQRQFGGVDVLVSNAGFRHVAPIAASPSDVFRAMLELMVVAPFVALRRLLPGMRARGWGGILPHVPQGRLLSVSEVAEAAIYLASGGA